jgi:hypothetical protein
LPLALHAAIAAGAVRRAPGIRAPAWSWVVNMAARERGYGGVVGRFAIYTAEELRARQRVQARASYRKKVPVVKQQHRVHRCNLCNQLGHNARTCAACQRCARAEGVWKTSEGRLCQACLEAVASHSASGS